MAVHKLHIGDFDEIDYQLIAIHTSLEDYRLAYFLNQNLPILLFKVPEDIQITTRQGIATFSRYSFECTNEDAVWDLISNQGETSSVYNNAGNLFADSALAVSTAVYLIPEYKNVGYFIKVQNAAIPVDEIITKIKSISRISTVYTIETQKIKSKNNLIF
ncbi:MAG: IPExxxVDY family protein [Flavobacterium sp.]|nr:IPExxxVDY family protein [Flavobacterium sp.]